MAASTITHFLTFWTRPLSFVAQDVARGHIEVSEEAAVAEERGAFVASSAAPFGVVDSTEMAEPAGGCILRAHEVVDGRAERLLPVSGRRSFRLEAHNLAGTVENLRAVGGRNDFGPGVGVGMFAGAAVEVAEETQIEVGALRAADVAIPDCGAAEVAGGDDGVWEGDELDGGGWGVVYRFIVDHLAKQAGEEGQIGR